MTIALRQQPMQHRAERRDPGSSCNKYGVTERRAQDEIAERSLKRDLRAFVETAEIVRHKSILHAIQAEGDLPLRGRRRRDRIRARHLLAIGIGGLHREPLPRNEAEAGDAAHFELKMLGKLGERDGAKQTDRKSTRLNSS